MQLVKPILLLFFFDALTLGISPILALHDFSIKTIILCAANIITGLAVLYLKNNYTIQEIELSKKRVWLLFEGIIFTNILLSIFALAVVLPPINCLIFLIKNIVISSILLTFSRISAKFCQKTIQKSKKCLIIGTNKRALTIAEEIRNTPALKMQIFGFIQEGEENLISDKENVFNNPTEIYSIIKENKIENIIITDNTKYLLNIPKCVKMFKMVDLYEKISGKYYIDEENINELFDYFENHQSTVYDFTKRIFDLISASIIAIFTFPIMIFISLRVFFTDKHSPLYTQKRVTKNNKIFNAYKLRTMYINNYRPNSQNLNEAENQGEDNRVIPFCKFVRKARFDEIPQMINILRGEMSIVGPRAEWDELVNVYKKEIQFHSCRHWVKTAWTGWAQINQGHCFAGDNEQIKLEYDLYYIKHRNLIWEIGILIKAVFMALGGRHG